MEPYEYQTFYDVEDDHWWYRGIRTVLLQFLPMIGAQTSWKILEAGCGTGGLLQALRNNDYDPAGFDFSPHAIPFWKKRNLPKVFQGSINAVASPSESFDVVLCVDVLEAHEVVEEKALNELFRIIRNEGYLFLLVPALSALMSRKHHQAVHAIRRYNRRTLQQLFDRLPARIIRLTYLFPSLFPAVFLYRSLQNLFSKDNEKPRSDLYRLPRWVNEMLFHIVKLEASLLQKGDFGFGSSLLVVAQKKE